MSSRQSSSGSSERVLFLCVDTGLDVVVMFLDACRLQDGVQSDCKVTAKDGGRRREKADCRRYFGLDLRWEDFWSRGFPSFSLSFFLLSSLCFSE